MVTEEEEQAEEEERGCAVNRGGERGREISSS